MRNKHKIGLGRPATKHKLGLKQALGSAASRNVARDEQTERILRDFFWSPPAAQPSASVHRFPAPTAESGASPRIAKKTD